MIEKSRNWCFHTLMKRLFFLNFYIERIKSFNLSDFTKSNFLNKKDKEFLSKQYIKMFEHEKEDRNENKKMKLITLKLERKIYSLFRT